MAFGYVSNLLFSFHLTSWVPSFSPPSLIPLNNNDDRDDAADDVDDDDDGALPILSMWFNDVIINGIKC